MLDGEGLCLRGGTGEAGLPGSPGIRGGAGLNGWTTGLVVCPELNLFDDLMVLEVGRLGLVDPGLGLPVGAVCSGFGLLGSSGFGPGARVASGLGLGWGFGASMGLMVGFFSTEKGLGLSLGLGPGTGLLGSVVMIWDWLMEGISMRVLLLESERGLR